ncbi:MAG: hypothetical protein GXX79_13815 [Actinomycetales bacterium]|nr:hypothetical protein [Actinomycetales bacterium]
MARRYLPGTDTGEPGVVKAVTGRLAVLSGRLDAVETVLEEHGKDLTALGRGLAALRTTQPTTPAPTVGKTAGSGGAGDSGDGEGSEGPRCWMTVADPDQAARWLTDATAWLGEVGSGHRLDLVPCWPLHPDVVAEVLALAETWRSAYQGNPTDVAEWLTRWLPAAKDRISASLNRCQVGHAINRTTYATDGLTPDAVAHWWTTDRTTSPEIALRTYLRDLDPR